MNKNILFLSLAFLLCGGAAARAAEDNPCLMCHGEKGSGAPFVDPAKMAASTHGPLACNSCHMDKDGYPHPEKKTPPVFCGGCHSDVADRLMASDHGKAIAKTKSGPAVCLGCHGDQHNIRRPSDPASPLHRSNIPATCDTCHKELFASGKLLFEPKTTYDKTVHGRAFLKDNKAKVAICTDCHGDHDINFPGNSASRINRARVPQTCGRCHTRQLALYSGSMHSKQAARGHKEAPVCTSCHGEHTIAAHGESGSSVFSGSVVKTCSSCHSSEKIMAQFGLPINPVASYMDSYHGVAFRAGNLTAANCASCHKYHDVLAPSDINSSVNPANLQKTCGSCHKKAGELVAKGKIHTDMTVAQTAGSYEWVLDMVKKMYILLIVLTLGGMMLHNLADLYRKGISGWHSHPDELRMSVNERIQHVFLALSFIGLAYTGFGHRYPDSLFNTVFFAGPSGAAMRTLLHRVFGGLFIALAIYHAAWLAAMREGRRCFMALLPGLNDIRDFFQLQKFNIFHKGEPPRFGHFSYMEKVEYWALIWGSFVMVITGCVVWFRELSLQFLPKWIIDLCLLVHFMEAILACLAILVWHSYWTVFDPAVYPMNWAWLTGKVALPRAAQAAKEAEEKE